MPKLAKKVVMIVAFRDFRDVEYFVPKSILEKRGIEVKTASNKKGVALGADGGEAEVDFLVSDIKVEDFDAIIFVGGPGCLKNLDNPTSYRVCKEAVLKDKILAAICISPTILAKSGVLSSKKATVWSSALDKSPIQVLRENGAEYLEEKVVVDGKVITASGPEAAEEFGKAIFELLTK
jgi:protease I